MNKKISYLSIITGASLWGCTGFFVKKLNSYNLSSLQTAALRVSVAAIVMIIITLIIDYKQLKIKFSDIKYFIGTGIISLAAFSYCYFSAIRLSSISVAVVLLYTSPVFVVVFSFFLFKEPLNIAKICAVIITIIGCVFVCGDNFKETANYMGIIFGIGSGLFYALYSIFGKYALEKHSSLTITTYTMLFASFILIPVSGITKSVQNIFHFPELIYIIGIGVICAVIPYLLYTYGLKGTQPGKAAILAATEPVVASIIGITVFNESLTLLKIIGMIMILSAIFIINHKN